LLILGLVLLERRGRPYGLAPEAQRGAGGGGFAPLAARQTFSG
jgi:hypothetical protein